MLGKKELQIFAQERSKTRETEFNELVEKFRSLQESERSTFFSSLSVEKRNLFFLEALRQNRFILFNAYLIHLTVVEKLTSIPPDAGYAVILPNGLLVPTGADSNRDEYGHNYCIEQYDKSIQNNSGDKPYFLTNGGMIIKKTEITVCRGGSLENLSTYQTYVDYLAVYKQLGRVINKDEVTIEMVNRTLVFSLKQLIEHGFKASFEKKYRKNSLLMIFLGKVSPRSK